MRRDETAVGVRLVEAAGLDDARLAAHARDMPIEPVAPPPA